MGYTENFNRRGPPRISGQYSQPLTPHYAIIADPPTFQHMQLQVAIWLIQGNPGMKKHAKVSMPLGE
jgi:hypothetical protein